MLINEDLSILHGFPRSCVACDTTIGVVAALVANYATHERRVIKYF